MLSPPGYIKFEMLHSLALKGFQNNFLKIYLNENAEKQTTYLAEHRPHWGTPAPAAVLEARLALGNPGKAMPTTQLTL